MSAPTYARGDGMTCIKCRRQFKKGDRMTPIYIVEGHGQDPKNPKQPGLMVGIEFEMAHAMCEDPQLMGAVIVGAR